MVILRTDKGQYVIVVSNRNRFWYVRDFFTRKCFTINKNKLNDVTENEISFIKEQAKQSEQDGKGNNG